MALIVEDGTGVTGAESYISVADASSYHSSLGNTAWAALASDTVREQLLRKATLYLEGVYRSRWAGYRKTDTQALSWPRVYVPVNDSQYRDYFFYDSDIVPVEVQRACAELALKAATAELSSDTSQQKLSTTVGEVSVTYDKYSPQNKQYTAVEAMLMPYLDGSGVTHKMVR